MTSEAVFLQPRQEFKARGPESKIFEKVKRVGREAKKLTEAGRERLAVWLKEMRRKVEERPREVIQEIQEALPPELRDELTKPVDIGKTIASEKEVDDQDSQVEMSGQKDPDVGPEDAYSAEDDKDELRSEKESLGVEPQTSVELEESKREKKSLFETRRQERGEFITELTPELKQAIAKGEVTSVFQKGIGFIDGSNSETRFLETSDFGGERPFFGSCVTVIAWGTESKITGLFHADSLTDITRAVEFSDGKFETDEMVELSVIGGQTGASEGILQEINAKLTPVAEKRGWILKRVDILGAKGVATRQVFVDAQDGSVFNLKGDTRTRVHPWKSEAEMPEKIKIRQLRAASVDKGLIIDNNF